MRLGTSRRSENVEDRRGMGLPRGVKIGGVGGLGLLLIVVIGALLGVDPTVLLQGEPGIFPPATEPCRHRLPGIPTSLRPMVSGR